MPRVAALGPANPRAKDANGDPIDTPLNLYIQIS
jgi:hypothetical protein